MITLAFYASLVTYFLPKTKFKKHIGLISLFATVLSFLFYIIFRIFGSNVGFLFIIANKWYAFNPIYWLFWWVKRIHVTGFYIVSTILQLILIFFAMNTTGYGFLQLILPKWAKDMIEKRVFKENSDENTVEVSDEKGQEKTEIKVEEIVENVKDLKAKIKSSKKSKKTTANTSEVNLDNLKLEFMKGRFVTVISVINFFIIAIAFAGLGFLFGDFIGGVVLGIVFAIVGFIISPFIWSLILKFVFAEIFLSINGVNNSAYAEVKRLNERIDALEKALEKNSSASSQQIDSVPETSVDF